MKQLHFCIKICYTKRFLLGSIEFILLCARHFGLKHLAVIDIFISPQGDTENDSWIGFWDKKVLVEVSKINLRFSP